MQKIANDLLRCSVYPKLPQELQIPNNFPNNSYQELSHCPIQRIMIQKLLQINIDIVSSLVKVGRASNDFFLLELEDGVIIDQWVTLYSISLGKHFLYQPLQMFKDSQQNNQVFILQNNSMFKMVISKTSFACFQLNQCTHFVQQKQLCDYLRPSQQEQQISQGFVQDWQIELTQEQNCCFEDVKLKLKSYNSATVLLKCPTGFGKTLIAFKALYSQVQSVFVICKTKQGVDQWFDQITNNVAIKCCIYKLYDAQGTCIGPQKCKQGTKYRQFCPYHSVSDSIKQQTNPIILISTYNYFFTPTLYRNHMPKQMEVGYIIDECHQMVKYVHDSIQNEMKFVCKMDTQQYQQMIGIGVAAHQPQRDFFQTKDPQLNDIFQTISKDQPPIISSKIQQTIWDKLMHSMLRLDLLGKIWKPLKGTTKQQFNCIYASEAQLHLKYQLQNDKSWLIRVTLNSFDVSFLTKMLPFQQHKGIIMLSATPPLKILYTFIPNLLLSQADTSKLTPSVKIVAIPEEWNKQNWEEVGSLGNKRLQQRLYQILGLVDSSFIISVNNKQYIDYIVQAWQNMEGTQKVKLVNENQYKQKTAEQLIKCDKQTIYCLLSYQDGYCSESLDMPGMFKYIFKMGLPFPNPQNKLVMSLQTGVQKKDQFKWIDKGLNSNFQTRPSEDDFLEPMSNPDQESEGSDIQDINKTTTTTSYAQHPMVRNYEKNEIKWDYALTRLCQLAGRVNRKSYLNHQQCQGVVYVFSSLFFEAIKSPLISPHIKLYLNDFQLVLGEK